MRYSGLCLFAAFAMLILLSLASAQDEMYLNRRCSGDSYTSNSMYKKNLDTLLSSMSSNNDINYGFYNFSKGEGGDRVKAIALCRGDIDQTACQRCLKFSTTNIRRWCPNQKEAIVWYDNCMLTYSNLTDHSRDETGFVILLSSDSTDPFERNRSSMLGSLLFGLRDNASLGDSHKKFAVGNTEQYKTIYGLVQCIPDLTELQCSDCLDSLLWESTILNQGTKGGRAMRPSCNFRYEDYPFYEISLPTPKPNETDLVPKTGGQIKNSTTQRSKYVIPIAASTSGTVAILIAICILILLKSRMGRPRPESEGQHILLSTYEHDIGSTEFFQFDLNTIRLATDNFKNENKLGQGGFGSVYKGKLLCGKEIAVKRLAAHSGQGDIEFTNEVVLVAKLQHRNLVKLLGYCLEGNERLLVYEFVPNSSLDRFLFDPLKRVYLDWEKRYKIISGIAKGLLYLHEDSRLRIIHRDLKAGNILLDEEMCPKIADFGMARLFIMNQTQGDTSRIVGTYGYMAPEYAMHGKFSVKSDVYSFGILLLEIISGQKNNRFRIGDKSHEPTSFAWENWKAGTAPSIIDPTILGSHINDILRCIHIGLLCVQDSVSARPTMASVVMMLGSASQFIPLPSKPAYLSSVESEMANTSCSGGEVSMLSINQVPITDLLPR